VSKHLQDLQDEWEKHKKSCVRCRSPNSHKNGMCERGKRITRRIVRRQVFV
jgi:hypothetical protein